MIRLRYESYGGYDECKENRDQQQGKRAERETKIVDKRACEQNKNKSFISHGTLISIRHFIHVIA